MSFVAPNVTLIEQNFDYDLLTPAKLMEKAVGSTVRLVRVNPATGAETSETAEVLSTVGGTVLRIGSRIEVLREDNLPTRVIFDKVPENLRAQPTLSVLVNAAKPVNETARLTYLTRGITWSADYVAVFDEPKSETSMQGWITLRNTSGTTFHQCARPARGRRRQSRRQRRTVVADVAAAAEHQSALGRHRELRSTSSSATTTSTRSSN